MTALKGGVLAGVVVLAAFVLLMIVVGCEPQSDSKGRKDCAARGGVYQKTGDHSGRCLPPRGGWQ